MNRVELIFDRDCPNVEAAREQLVVALGRAGLPTDWIEWDRADPAAPDYVRPYGSPTVLVDGRDVAGDSGANAAQACRVYLDASGTRSAAPSAEGILAALGRQG